MCPQDIGKQLSWFLYFFFLPLTSVFFNYSLNNKVLIYFTILVVLSRKSLCCSCVSFTIKKLLMKKKTLTETVI